jgi:thiamine kinase-like enzyme
MKEVVDFWQISFAGFGDKALITGSPNRTEDRFIFRDGNGDFYIAEGYSLKKHSQQIRQNLFLEFLASNNLCGIHPFLRTKTGEHGAAVNNLFWQIRPYIPAGKFQREELAGKAENGIIWADFLLNMKNIVERSGNQPTVSAAPFYMSEFFPMLLNFAEIKKPAIVKQLLEFGKNQFAHFFEWEKRTAGFIAHGDFHPGNILMDGGKIAAVIDWEFSGIKFPGYDMALLIGCLAMDHPLNLDSPAVRAFQDTLYRNKFISDECWEQLTLMIAATRLGWLGEWLLLDEDALVDQEMTLLSILLDN